MHNARVADGTRVGKTPGRLLEIRGIPELIVPRVVRAGSFSFSFFCGSQAMALMPLAVDGGWNVRCSEFLKSFCALGV